MNKIVIDGNIKCFTVKKVLQELPYLHLYIHQYYPDIDIYGNVAQLDITTLAKAFGMQCFFENDTAYLTTHSDDIVSVAKTLLGHNKNSAKECTIFQVTYANILYFFNFSLTEGDCRFVVEHFKITALNNVGLCHFEKDMQLNTCYELTYQGIKTLVTIITNHIKNTMDNV